MKEIGNCEDCVTRLIEITEKRVVKQYRVEGNEQKN